jgi:LAGLIDADG endonuclease
MFFIILISLERNFYYSRIEWGWYAWFSFKLNEKNQRLKVERFNLISFFNIDNNQKLIKKNSFSVQANNLELNCSNGKSIIKPKLNSNKDNFFQWLVGFTDGDGSFSICREKKGNCKPKWSLFFKISQSNYNLRALYYIKKELGYGSIQLESKTNNADFRIRNKEIINKILFPIFDKYPLLTSKSFNYYKFKKAYGILNNNDMSWEEKDNALLLLRDEKIPTNYMSPAWEKIKYKVENTIDSMLVMNKYWLVGFTEAEGSFYLVLKDTKRLVHGFEITQKLDLIVLQSIARILGIRVNKKKNYNTVVTTNSRAISNIITYYKNTMKGMKALEYRIWARSYIQHKGNFDELDKVKKRINKIRSIRLDKNCSIKDNGFMD